MQIYRKCLINISYDCEGGGNLGKEYSWDGTWSLVYYSRLVYK